MGTVSDRAFAAALGDLDRTTFTDFVRDLLGTRGYDVETVGDGMLVATEGGLEQVVFVHCPSGFGRRSPTPPEEVDTIVTSAFDSDRARRLVADRDATLLDAGDLHGLLCYGLDRERANEVSLTYLDRSLSISRGSDDPADARTDRHRAGTLAGLRETVDRWGSAVAAALIVTLVMVGALSVGVPGGIDTAKVLSGDEGNAGGTSGPTAVGVEGVSVTPAPAATAGPSLEPTNEPVGKLPSELSRAGITDADALAAAHERALGNESYRWVVTYTERVSGRTVARTRETVAFERPEVYSVGVNQQGDPRGVPTLFASGPAYADGESRYEPIRVAGSREDVQVIDLPVTEERDFRERAGTYIEWYLSVSRSAITDVVDRNGRILYRVETIGDPYPGADNARASALVDSRGMVHELHSEREVPDSDVTVVLTFRYTGVGTTTVEPPAWYEANGSASTTATAAATTTATRTATAPRKDTESD